MNKKLIAMAVGAAMAAPLAAQAAPTLYGHLQVEIASVDNNGIASNNDGKSGRVDAAAGQSALSLADNKRGRLGIKGSEDLGGNLKALYKFEWQVDTASGDITDGARESWVGLKGNFGEVKAGRVKTAYKYNGGVKYDPFVTTYIEARGNAGMTGGAFGQNSFWDTSLSYKNKFGDVSLWVVYGVDEGTGIAGSGNNGDLSAALKYSAKNFEVFVASNSDDSNSTNDRTKVGGQWKSGAHKISAQYEMQDDTNNTDTLFVGYQMKMGKNILAAQIGQASGDNSTLDTDYLAVGVIHKFSKKTRAFLGYGSEDRDNGTDYSAVTAGMRIDF